MPNHDLAQVAERIEDARDLSELEPSVRAGLKRALDCVPSQLTLVFQLPDTPLYVALCNRHTLGSDRHLVLSRAVVPLEERLTQETGVTEALSSLGTWVDMTLPCTADWRETEPGPSILAYARPENCPMTILWLGLGTKLGISENQKASLALVATAASRAASHFLQHEILRCRHSLLRAASEAALGPLGAGDRPELLNGLAEVLDRQFGFNRIFIALLHAPSGALRCELHSGFEEGFEPRPISLHDSQDPLIRALELGKPIFIEQTNGAQPAVAALLGEDSRERGVLAPMRLGPRTVGLIYADRPRAQEVFVFKEAFSAFLRLASVAVDHLEQRLNAENRAETDPLTGARNRHFLDRVLEIEIPRVRRYKSPISLLMIDLCDFKRTNDTYGHVFGDHILRETAKLIQSNVRQPDVVVRYGGDEFVVLMANTNYEQACLVQDRIEKAFIERNRTQDDPKMMIDISIGLRSADEKTIETLLEDADQAMYENKEARRRGQIVETMLGVGPPRPDAVDKVISSLLSNLGNREPQYRAHSLRVAHLCLILAREFDFDPTDINALLLGALLHDVGKASLPSEVLQRPGPLSDAEYQAVQGHAVVGEEFLGGIAHLECARPLIRHHHERFDGKITGEFPGYPHGLSGEAIPLGARILKLADSLDAITSDRPYRAARPLAEALEIIRSESGASFDPKVVKALLRAENSLADVGSESALRALYEKTVAETEQE